MLDVIQLRNSFYTPFSCLFSIAQDFSEKDFINSDIELLASQMLETLYLAPAGVGLAANQVGILKRICVVDCKRDGKHPLVLVNPTYIAQTEDTIKSIEVCLSFPNVCVETKRYQTIQVDYLDIYGHSQILEAKDFLACVLQHEIDHLDGKPHITKADSPTAILPYEGNAVKKARQAMSVVLDKAE